MKGKIFTAEGITKMLPLLRRIVMDLKACAKLVARHERAVAEIEFQAEESGADPSEDALSEHREKISALREKFASCERELNELGGYVEDADLGIIKFYGERDSRIVYLTWTLGEAEVTFWYPIEKGYADRQRVDDGEKIAEARPS